ncbi:MAG: hypothetical protein KIT22_15165, partial [Verrucomicrobiae bacterium]|nr:hypothetical protein [Verrucomicrobiae bacterium]
TASFAPSAAISHGVPPRTAEHPLDIQVIALGLQEEPDSPSLALTYVHPLPAFMEGRVELLSSHDFVTWQIVPYVVLVSQEAAGLRFESVRVAGPMPSLGTFFRVELATEIPELLPP